MSGGHFAYKQHVITEIADEIEHVIENNDSAEVNRWGDKVGYGFLPDIIEEFQRAVIVLRQAAIYAQCIDWLLSGDDGEESFRRQLRKELAEFGAKP